MSRAAPGVHVIVGGRAFDSYLAEEALERLLGEAVGTARGEAVALLRGDESSWVRVLDAARMRSLFSERRALVVRNAEALRGDGEGLANYLDDPTPGVALILVAARPDRRRSVWKLLLARSEVVTAEPLKEPALRRRLGEELRRRGLEIGAEGLEEIVGRVGQDLRRALGELDKLEALAAGRGRLSPEEVAACLGRGLAQPLYRLSDALMGRRRSEVLARMQAALDEGEAAVLVLGTLFRALRTLRGAGQLRGRPWAELASRLGVPAFKVKDVLEATRRWSEPELRAALFAMGEADRLLKSGGEPRVALTAAVVAACGGSAARPSPRPWR